MDSYLIHAVAFRRKSHWVAQCLEYNIATQAKTLDALLYELERILVGHVLVADQEQTEPFVGLQGAPKRFWEMYKRALAPVTPAQRSELLPSIPAQRRPRVEVAFAEEKEAA